MNYTITVETIRTAADAVKTTRTRITDPDTGKPYINPDKDTALKDAERLARTFADNPIVKAFNVVQRVALDLDTPEAHTATFNETIHTYKT